MALSVSGLPSPGWHILDPVWLEALSFTLPKEAVVQSIVIRGGLANPQAAIGQDFQGGGVTLPTAVLPSAEGGLPVQKFCMGRKIMIDYTVLLCPLWVQTVFS